ncbi:MAG: UPF0149 family protein [Gammaproteobacteria bacterium]
MVYQTIDRIIKQKGGDFSAAEAHGIATGMLCIDANTDAGNWLSELFVDASTSDEDMAVLTHLFEQTAELLDSEDYSFDLLLPDDDDNLVAQVEALRAWCQGFLFGIGFSRSVDEGVGKSDEIRRSVTDWPGETGEILKDIVEFTKMDSTEMSLDQEEEDVAAFVEINEYLRVAVYLIRNEFNKKTNATFH